MGRFRRRLEAGQDRRLRPWLTHATAPGGRADAGRLPLRREAAGVLRARPSCTTTGLCFGS